MNPIILYKNILKSDGAVLSAGTTGDGYNVDNLKDPRTYTKWAAADDSNVNIDIVLENAENCNCIGIHNHNLFTRDATIKIQSSLDGNSWTTLLTFQPNSDFTQLKIFTSNNAVRYWRINLTTLSGVPEIAVIYLGTRINFEWPPESPYVPKSESISADSAQSGAGHFLGADYKYSPLKITAQFKFFSRAFFTSYFNAFWKDHGRKLIPFFYGYDLTNDPDKVYFVKLDESSVYETAQSVLSYADSFTLNMAGISE